MDELKKKKRSIVHPNNPDNSQRRRWRRPCDNVPSANYLYIVYTNYFSNVYPFQSVARSRNSYATILTV